MVWPPDACLEADTAAVRRSFRGWRRTARRALDLATHARRLCRHRRRSGGFGGAGEPGSGFRPGARRLRPAWDRHELSGVRGCPAADRWRRVPGFWRPLAERRAFGPSACSLRSSCRKATTSSSTPATTTPATPASPASALGAMRLRWGRAVLTGECGRVPAELSGSRGPTCEAGTRRSGLLSRHRRVGKSEPSAQLSFIFNAAINALCGISTWPNWRMRFLPSFCLSSSLRLRLMSPP